MYIGVITKKSQCEYTLKLLEIGALLLILRCMLPNALRTLMLPMSLNDVMHAILNTLFPPTRFLVIRLIYCVVLDLLPPMIVTSCMDHQMCQQIFF